MADFKIISNFKPKGDQPSAISQITDSINNGDDFITLLGVTDQENFYDGKRN